MAEDDPGYVSAWQRYRQWARARLVAFVAFVPFASAGYLLCIRARVPSLAPALAVVWFAFAITTVIGAAMMACPRCGKPFFFTWWWSNPLARRCVHCGLPKWATQDCDDQ